nr:hypothetical protein [uncultured Prevotella sp.]
MKKLLIFALFLGLQTVAMAQESNGLEKNKAVYLELLGPSNLAGINYDARFNDHTRFGWRAGLSFAYGKNSGLFGQGSNVRGYVVPLEVNYLVGRQKNNLELGLGTGLGIYNVHETRGEVVNGPASSLTAEQQKHVIGEYKTDNGTQTLLAYEESRNTFDYYFFGNIGYRHVSNNGFLFRAGITPAFTFSKDASKKVNFRPYVAFGWAF